MDKTSQPLLKQRRHLRIKYPESGPIGFLPVVSMEDIFVSAIDIGEGGMALRVDDDLLYSDYFQQLEMSLQFPMVSDIHKVKAKVVGVAQGIRNIQFIDISDECKLSINLAVQSGIRGLGTIHVTQDFLPLDSGGVEEWLCPFGGHIKLYEIHFQKGEPVFKYRGPDYSVELYRSYMAMARLRSNKDLPLVPLDLETFDNIELMFLNIPNPSPRLVMIVSYLAKYRELAMAGKLERKP
jgi:hypothetical protein